MSDVPPAPVPTQAEANDLMEQVLGVTDESEPASAPPVNVDVPHVTGNAAVGQILNSTMGNWDGTPDSYAYQWKSDAADVGDGSANYLVVATDAGHSITCVVTATNALGSTAAPPSNAVAIP